MNYLKAMICHFILCNSYIRFTLQMGFQITSNRSRFNYLQALAAKKQPKQKQKQNNNNVVVKLIWISEMPIWTCQNKAKWNEMKHKLNSLYLIPIYSLPLNFEKVIKYIYIKQERLFVSIASIENENENEKKNSKIDEEKEVYLLLTPNYIHRNLCFIRCTAPTFAC